MPFILGALVIGALSIHRWRKTPEGRRKTDEWILKIPIVGKICRNIDVCRMTNLTSTLIESGVNTTEALRMTERSIQNTVLRENFSAARIMINDGAAFSLALRKHAVLDDTDLDILSIGESTGNIARSFKEIFKNHTQDLDSEFKILIRTVAGVAMGSAFGLVALLALGIVTSVLQLSQSIMAR